MAKKKLGYTELQWVCSACGHRNKGTTKTCASCGATMLDDADFVEGGGKLDTSQEAADRVAAGPDFICPYCGARNRGDAQKCVQCGGDLSDAARRKAGGVVGAYDAPSAKPKPPITCPHCGASNPADRENCSQCGGALRDEPAPKPRVAASSGPPPQAPKWPIVLFGVFAVIVVIMIMLTRGGAERPAVVSGVEWLYTIEMQKLALVEREAWRDDVPAQGQVLSCSDKVRHTYEQPVVGAVEVCGTPYVVDTGTGVGEVVQDCVYHLYDDWCRYSIMDWVAAEPVQTQGYDYDPEWPQLPYSTSQREVGRQEGYTVYLEGDGETYRYYPDTLYEFRQFSEGSRWTIRPNSFGAVMDISPAD